MSIIVPVALLLGLIVLMLIVWFVWKLVKCVIVLIIIAIIVTALWQLGALEDIIPLGENLIDILI